MTIRRVPEDFVVTERLSLDARGSIRACWSRTDRFAVFTLTKSGLTTPDACGLLARALGVKPGLVTWAGLKDRHAVTHQHVSVRFDQPPPGGLAAGTAPLSGPSWSAQPLGFRVEALDAADIEANRFDIVVRRLQRRDTGAFDQRVAALSVAPDGLLVAPGALLIANYFGDQRFGSARHGEGFAAMALVRGDFEAALRLLIATPARKDSGSWRAFTRACAQRWGDWPGQLETLPRRAERAPIEALASGATMRDAFLALPAFTQQMCVEAFQSFVWNGALRRVAARLSERCFRADDEFGEMWFPRAKDLSPDDEPLVMPLPAPGIALHEPCGPALLEALGEHALTPDQLVIPGVRRPRFESVSRPVFVRASAFTAGEPEPDDLAAGPLLKRRVSFDLPRGAYATVVLRALGW